MKTKKVKVKRSLGKGLGLFADEQIKKGEYVISYTGELITSAEADKRGTRYLFELDDDYVIDGSGRENVARYINHACKPNLEAEIEDGQIHLSALRSIMPGEELNFDYGEEYFDEFIKPHGCKCASCN